jgi:hypothetical protein
MDIPTYSTFHFAVAAQILYEKPTLKVAKCVK